MNGAIEQAVSRLLRAGVALSAVLVTLGMAITFIRHPEYRTSAEALAPLLAAGTERSPEVLLGNLPALRGQSFVLLGLLVLVATPIVRVAMLGVLFARRGERWLALSGLGVLILLLASFVLGHALA